MSALPTSEILEMIRNCRTTPCEDPLGPLQGKELVQLARRVEGHMQPRATPGRRAADKVDIAASIAQLTSLVSAVLDELQSTRDELDLAKASLLLSVTLLNRERGFIDAASEKITA